MISTLDELVRILDEKEMPYEETKLNNGYRCVHVFDKVAYERKKKHPVKYKNEFVPYIRVSDHNGDPYIRDCGICYTSTWENVLKMIEKLEA